MLRPHFITAIALMATVAACGGAGATSAPGGGAGATSAPGGGAGATSAPGGGGVSGGGGTGKVTYTVTGDVQKSGELPFFGYASRFGGDTGVSLQFVRDEEGSPIFSITGQNDAYAIGLVDDEHALSWSDCEILEIDLTGTNASGRFECSQGFGTGVESESVLSNLQISGTFDAHA